MMRNKTSQKSTYVHKCQFQNLCKDIRNIPQQATEPCGTKKVHRRGCPAPLTGSFAPKHNTYQKKFLEIKIVIIKARCY